MFRSRKKQNKKIIIWLVAVIIIIAGLWLYNDYRGRQIARQAKWTARPEKNITLIAGWNLKNINSYLDDQGFKFSADLLKLKARDYAATYDFLADAPKNATLEGYIFPDTYRVYASSTLDEVLAKPLNNFSAKLTPTMRMDIQKQGKSVYEILTMASILEKEVKTPSDLKIVSGIFWQRIKNGQPLQSCATLAYVLGVNKPQYSDADTQANSLYNTYKYRGLPPGPISNPGLEAIMAAIYPTASAYNYFLSRPDTGATIFSQTYSEHLKNKAKYLK